jgi:hypothetical protein
MLDRKTVSFRDAEKSTKYPGLLAWGEVDNRLRAAVWNAIYVFLAAHIRSDHHGRVMVENKIKGLLLREYVDRRHGHIDVFDDKITGYRSDYLDEWKEYFLRLDYIELFDCVQFIARDDDCPAYFRDSLEDALDQPYSPYRLVPNPPTVIPAVSEEEATQLKAELDEAFSSGFLGAKAHLRQALDRLNAGDARSVIREAIHAVESAVRDVAGNPKATLSDIFRKSTSVTNIHPALRIAFEKLYAYTSDENGIRHALMDEDDEKVASAEAIFFLSACAAFVGYLSRKQATRIDALLPSRIRAFREDS